MLEIPFQNIYQMKNTRICARLLLCFYVCFFCRSQIDPSNDVNPLTPGVQALKG